MINCILTRWNKLELQDMNIKTGLSLKSQEVCLTLYGNKIPPSHTHTHTHTQIASGFWAKHVHWNLLWIFLRRGKKESLLVPSLSRSIFRVGEFRRSVPQYLTYRLITAYLLLVSEFRQNNARALRFWYVKCTSIKIEVQVHYFVQILEHKVNTQLLI